MKSSYFALALMAFGFGLTMLYNPHLWYYSGLNLLLAVMLTLKDRLILRQKAKIEFLGTLLSLAKVVIEAKNRVAKKEGAGPWERNQ